MRILFALIFTFTALLLVEVHPDLCSASNGEEVFNKLRCGSCHKPDQKAAAVSLQEISKAYGGDRAKLLNFFNGQGERMIETDKPGQMKGQLVKIRELSEEDKEALSDYVLGFK